MTDFDKLLEDIEAEAKAAGPETVAQLRGFQNQFRLASELLTLRCESNMTQKQLAKAAGIQQADISRIERGEINPTTATVGRLAAAFGVGFGFYRAEGEVARPVEPMTGIQKNLLGDAAGYVIEKGGEIVSRGDSTVKAMAAGKAKSRGASTKAAAKSTSRSSSGAKKPATHVKSAKRSASSRAKPKG
jgi:XRE family transcriptional regulator, regulator of sulfur utilization